MKRGGCWLPVQSHKLSHVGSIPTPASIRRETMGIFDIFEDIVEKTAETITSIPSAPARFLNGVEKGTKKGIEEVEKAWEELFDK